jgi:hypothetical protein
MTKNSYSSPKGGNRGCLCKDETYSPDCCDGEIISQGVGALVDQVVSNVNNTNAPRTIISVSN